MPRLSRQFLFAAAIIVLGVLSLVAMKKFRPEPAHQAPAEVLPLVDVVLARPGPHTFHVEAQGTVQPRTSSSLVAEVAAAVRSVSEDFSTGGFFETGEVLITLADEDYRAAVAVAESDVATARLARAREEEEARVAREEWERFGHEGEPTALVLREPQLAQADAQVSAAEARLERARRDLERTRVRAPFAGRVRQKFVDVGDYVAPGTPAASIYSIDYAEIRIPLVDEDLAFLDLPLRHRGEAAAGQHGPVVRLSGTFAGTTHEWQGYVDRTEGEIDPRTRMITLVVRVPDPWGKGASEDGTPLGIGLFVDASITGRTVDPVVVLPEEVMVDEHRVAVVDDEDRLALHEVNLLRRSDGEVFIGEGLADGDRVVRSQLDYVVEGMKLRVSTGTGQ